MAGITLINGVPRIGKYQTEGISSTLSLLDGSNTVVAKNGKIEQTELSNLNLSDPGTQVLATALSSFITPFNSFDITPANIALLQQMEVADDTSKPYTNTAMKYVKSTDEDPLFIVDNPVASVRNAMFVWDFNGTKINITDTKTVNPADYSKYGINPSAEQQALIVTDAEYYNYFTDALLPVINGNIQITKSPLNVNLMMPATQDSSNSVSIQSSFDLKTWTPAGAMLKEEDGTNKVYKAEVPAVGPSMFFRASVDLGLDAKLEKRDDT